MTKRYCYECKKEQEVTYDNYVDLEENFEGELVGIRINIYIHCTQCNYYIEQKRIDIEKKESWTIT